jgi:hypothetical protein
VLDSWRIGTEVVNIDKVVEVLGKEEPIPVGERNSFLCRHESQIPSGITVFAHGLSKRPDFVLVTSKMHEAKAGYSQVGITTDEFNITLNNPNPPMDVTIFAQRLHSIIR